MKRSEFYIYNEMDILLITLEKFNVFPTHYSIFEEKDKTICLDYLFDYWVIYYSKGNSKTNIKAHDNFHEACTEMFRALSNSKDKQQAMLKYYDVFTMQLKEIGYQLDKAENYIPKIEQIDIEKETKVR